MICDSHLKALLTNAYIRARKPAWPVHLILGGRPLMGCVRLRSEYRQWQVINMHHSVRAFLHTVIIIMIMASGEFQINGKQNPSSDLITELPYPTRMFAGKVNLSDKDMIVSLDDIAAHLRRVNPGDQAQVMVYYGRHYTALQANRHARLLKNYLQHTGRVTAPINIIVGGCRQKPMIEVWFVPNGRERPYKSPDCHSH